VHAVEGSQGLFTASLRPNNVHTGSGWGWLVWDQAKNRLDIMTTSNQDRPTEVRAGVVPILGVDVWEHAYYLDYENRRPEYLTNIWQIVNWKNVEERFNNARQL